ncbi:hypothetical protein DV737_g4028, partial [Chaetothyriales sp. CBS 132003]
MPQPLNPTVRQKDLCRVLVEAEVAGAVVEEVEVAAVAMVEAAHVEEETEEEEQVKKLEQRQQELKKHFHTVGTRQTELLEQLRSRDLNKLTKKARAHTKVPEYDEVQADLEAAAQKKREEIRKWYEIAVEAEMKRFEQEKEVIESQFRRRCEDTRLEHLQGLQGDIISLKKAHATALDETHTETGSEVDYFPHYHELPEPDARVRGYTSNKITDEKPFKQYLESHSDLDLQEVINEDITGPMIESLARENAKHAQEQRIKKTQTLEALCEVASEPDIAIWKAEQGAAQQRYPFTPAGGPNQQYLGSPSVLAAAPGQVNGRPLAPAPTPILAQPIQVTAVAAKRSRNKTSLFSSAHVNRSASPDSYLCNFFHQHVSSPTTSIARFISRATASPLPFATASSLASVSSFTPTFRPAFSRTSICVSTTGRHASFILSRHDGGGAGHPACSSYGRGSSSRSTKDDYSDSNVINTHTDNDDYVIISTTTIVSDNVPVWLHSQHHDPSTGPQHEHGSARRR